MVLRDGTESGNAGVGGEALRASAGESEVDRGDVVVEAMWS